MSAMVWDPGGMREAYRMWPEAAETAYASGDGQAYGDVRHVVFAGMGDPEPSGTLSGRSCRVWMYMSAW